jgi:YD repeat-containing protein
MVDVSKDPCTHPTTFTYSSTYVGAFPTTVSNAANQSFIYEYDFNTGRLASKKDPSNQITGYSYDSMWRLASVTYPDGGLDTITRQETSFPYTATLTSKITSSQNKSLTKVFDGLARLSAQKLIAPCGVIETDYTYDALGRKSTVSNPYCSKSDPTYGVTTYGYDPLGRQTVVTKPDNSTVQTAYCGGESTLVTDEAKHWRRSTVDGLGRMIEVDEPNSAIATVAACPQSGDPVWVTTYAHDTLDDLTGVVQGGSHQRSFAFDSLKRLTSSTNPETGSLPYTYTYDADGNPVTKVDARNIIIAYSWDVLNPMTGRTYSNGDPSVTYVYDQTTCVVVPSCYNVGKLTSTSDAAGSEKISYDPMGRVWADQRTTNNITKNVSRFYNFDGSTNKLTYPSGNAMVYAVNSDSQPVSVTDTTNSIAYAAGATYAPQGAISALTLGSSINMSNTYNDRLQPNELKAWSTAATAFDLTYNFSSGTDNGKVAQITNNLNANRRPSEPNLDSSHDFDLYYQLLVSNVQLRPMGQSLLCRCNWNGSRVELDCRFFQPNHNRRIYLRSCRQ